VTAPRTGVATRTTARAAARARGRCCSDNKSIVVPTAAQRLSRSQPTTAVIGYHKRESHRTPTQPQEELIPRHVPLLSQRCNRLTVRDQPTILRSDRVYCFTVRAPERSRVLQCCCSLPPIELPIRIYYKSHTEPIELPIRTLYESTVPIGLPHRISQRTD
jgi:hypothetical protein